MQEQKGTVNREMKMLRKNKKKNQKSKTLTNEKHKQTEHNQGKNLG